MMKKISHKKVWSFGAVQIHVYSSHIPLDKSEIENKIVKFYVKIKLRRNPTLATYHMYEFKVEILEMGIRKSYFFIGTYIWRLNNL